MTPTERRYMKALGKLYNIERYRYGVAYIVMVMPYAIAKYGGWWTFICHQLNNRDMAYNPDHVNIPCKEFMRKAIILSNQPPPVK